MNREEAIKKHRELWHWIADEHRRTRSVFVNKSDNPDVAKEEPANDCWLCEYVLQSDKDCGDCPINWGTKTCNRFGSPYRMWLSNDSLNYEILANFADIIAELPEKK